MKARILAAFCVAVGIVACADSTAPVPKTAIVGTWLWSKSPGTSIEMTLLLADDSLTGFGSWTGEALGFGGVNGGGHIFGDSVQLDLVLATNPAPGVSSTQHATFSGHLASSQSLVGRLAYDTQTPFDVSFDKIQRDPPN